MKIKKIAYILCGLLLVSCNDSFLERYPDTDLSDKTYFTSEKDWNFILILSIMS